MSEENSHDETLSSRLSEEELYRNYLVQTRIRRDRISVVISIVVTIVIGVVASVVFTEQPQFSLFGFLFVESKFSFARFLSMLAIISSAMTFAFFFYRAVSNSSASYREIYLEIEKERSVLTKDQLKGYAVRQQAEREVRKEQQQRAAAAEKITKSLRNSDNSIVEDWREPLISARLRIFEDFERLKRRSSFNLNWGAIISAISVVLILMMVFTGNKETEITSWISFLSYFGPRLTLIISLQLLGFFFLKNFLKTEHEITQNNNEITNLEMRMAAALMLASYGDGHLKIAEKLAGEDRNGAYSRLEIGGYDDDPKTTIDLIKAIKDMKLK